MYITIILVNQNITIIQISISIQIDTTKPTWQDVEKSIIDILRAGVYCRKPKDKGFMSWYKKQLNELHQYENPETHIYKKAIDKFPNKETYNLTIETHKTYYTLCYTIIKDIFATVEEMEEEFNSWLNS